jgi:hypothetical protein
MSHVKMSGILPARIVACRSRRSYRSRVHDISNAAESGRRGGVTRSPKQLMGRSIGGSWRKMKLVLLAA